MAHLQILIATRRNIKTRNSPLRLRNMTEDEVMQSTRFTSSAVREIIGMVGENLERSTSRSNAVPVDTQVLAALQFFASGSFQWMIGRSCGLSQASVSLCIDAVTKELVKIAPQFIKFPTDPAELRDSKVKFHAVAGFPNVVGAIDCTHVAIRAPSTHEDVYVNRKGCHTINVQAVCDSESKLLNVVAKWPGSTHDSFIWKNSTLRDVFVDGGIQEGCLLGMQIFYYFIIIK